MSWSRADCLSVVLGASFCIAGCESDPEECRDDDGLCMLPVVASDGDGCPSIRVRSDLPGCLGTEICCVPIE